MKKVKYYYNTNTLRYEKLEVPLRVKLLRVLGFLAAATVSALIIVAIAFKYLDSPKELILKQQNQALEEDYAILSNRLHDLESQLNELEKRDNEVYRIIFEADPIPDSARAKQLESLKERQLVARMSNSELSRSIAANIANLQNRMEAQKRSYAEIEGFIKNKEDLLASTPAIQPVKNQDLKRLASGFGYRIDPIYKTTKFHAGLDFSAPQGTPIYASANGTVVIAGNLGNAYGNHVVIRHGYGYETLYGHMYRIKVKKGAKVKRGEIIGYIGSTGKSTGPHLHYEVHRNGVPVDPIYYFYNDLTPEQFDRILKMAAAGNQSFD
jgi:murein DD-endopeptidase MepM/ murein hydrolase activator NlpD